MNEFMNTVKEITETFDVGFEWVTADYAPIQVVRVLRDDEVIGEGHGQTRQVAMYRAEAIIFGEGVAELRHRQLG